MAKVFTITPGLENMGAMKTGGQGSVYKGRRVGEIITAIKLLPTPIYSESVEDKNYRDFQNEVQKLKEVNKVPNPNVVKILSSGLSETGNFPFIEMEYIDGPDLEELLNTPHDRVFTIKEVIKVAEQLSNALGHCHKYDVKHGDIKSNNIKLNLNTGNYVLLDFGLAIMNDEQRRTSLRQAGAVEFMAPEQNEGEMLFQSDVYSFGVVIYELLAGRVPFPLEDKTETARNHVRLAHLESVAPDLLILRRQNLPVSWSPERRDREMQVPEWLVTMAYTCLRKKPDSRFANGMELHDFIIYHSTPLLSADKLTNPVFSKANSDVEKEQLKQQLAQQKQQIDALQKETADLKILVKNSDKPFSPQPVLKQPKQQVGVSANSFIILLLITIGLACYSVYSVFTHASNDSGITNSVTDSTAGMDTSALQQPTLTQQTTLTKQQEDFLKQRKADSLKAIQHAKLAAQRAIDSIARAGADSTDNASAPTKPDKSVQYMVVSKAYFYTTPDEATRRNVFVQPSNSAIVTAEQEQGNFVFVSFTTTKGDVSKGWLHKKDLQQLSD